MGDAAGKPSKLVHVGNRLVVMRGEDRYEIDVVDLRERRGTAAQALACYKETEASRSARERAAGQRRLDATGYTKPATKPDKRARRLIRALGDIDTW
jgi:ribosome-associated heat shock protein Hsp15